MKVSIVQSDIVWEKAKENLNRLKERISTIRDTDLIILPEMFSTGFTMDPKQVAEPMDGETVNWMKAVAAQQNAAVCGSVVIEEAGRFYNRLLFVYPSGETVGYNKRHLFTLAGEHNAYTPGRDKIIVDHKGFRICLMICYDLRFPVFSRNKDDYDLLLYVANWPEPRIAAWDTLLKARAIENMAFVIGANRVGSDANGHNYVGHSQVIDAFGKSLLGQSEADEVLTVELNKNALLEARQKFGFLNDRDQFTVI
jgi:omega-amidase